MIKAINLQKIYGPVTALHDVSFSVKPGEIIGLLGPNGAGKTTLMKILSGFLQPDSGSATVDGYDVVDQCRIIQNKIGYMPENAPLYPELTVQAYLRMIADLRNIPAKDQNRRLCDTITDVGLQDRLSRPIGTLSKGYRQRVCLAQAILHQPDLLILDEPTNGLDPTQIFHVRNLIRKLSATSTILISTHILSEVEATCDRAIIIINGSIKADAGLSELASTATATLVVKTSSPENIRQKLASVYGAEKLDVTEENNKTSFSIASETKDDICPRLYQMARDNNWNLFELRRQTRTLESVFNELAAGGGQ